MSELRAEQGALNVAGAEAKSTRYRDVLIALAAFVMLALLPVLTSSKFLLDFVIRCAAYGLFATSLNLLVGYTGLTSFGHGMFFGLGAYGFGLMMQKTGVPIPVAFVATLLITLVVAAVIGAICVRLKEIYFRLRHARVPDADPLHHPVLGVVHRRRPGAARRHSAAAVPRHRSFQPSASLYLQLRAARDRPAADAPDRAVAVRLYACA